jgi:hypothetical protein
MQLDSLVACSRKALIRINALANIGSTRISQATALRNAGTLARMMISEANAAAYLRFADAYAALTEQQEQLARYIAEVKINLMTVNFPQLPFRPTERFEH